MALRRDLTYPARYDAATPNQPQGAFKNRSAPAVLDGSYLEEGWLNDWSGFFGRLLTKAGFTPNGAVDDALNSQYMDAAELAFYNRVGRNLFVNGDFLIWERGFIIPTVDTGTGRQYTTDQWKHSVNGGAFAGQVAMEWFDTGQQEVPNNPYRYLSWTGNIGTNVASEFVMLGNIISNVRQISDEYVTMSCNIKGSIAGNIGLYLLQSYGTSSPDSPTVPFSTVIPVTTDWVQHTFTFHVPDISGKTVDPLDYDDQLYWRFVKQVGPTLGGQIGTGAINYGGTISLADCQFEKGQKRTDYERLDIMTQLNLCQHFFQRFIHFSYRPFIASGFGIDICRTSPIPFTVPMRVPPSWTHSDSPPFGGVDFDTNNANLVGPGGTGSTQTICLALTTTHFDIRPFTVSQFSNQGSYSVRPTTGITYYFTAEL